MLTHRIFESTMEIFAGLSAEDMLETEAGWISAYTDISKDGQGTILDDWQVLNINNTFRYQLYVKSRQVGFSLVQSLKKLARSALKPGYKGVFISIDRAEAQEKLRYLNLAWESLDPEWREGDLTRIKNNTSQVEFRNKSRITSFASKAPRGQSESDLTFDEAAHVKGARDKFNGATGIALQSPDATIEVGSSPLSATGFFYDLVADTDGMYSVFKGQRYFVHWWDSYSLCKDVRAARREAEANRWDIQDGRADVEYRVNKFGQQTLIDEFYSRSTDQFRQEYECAFTSDNAALIAIDHLNKCSDNNLEYIFHGENKPSQTWYLYQATEEYVKNILIPAVDVALTAIDTDTPIYVGFDPASKRHQSVITFVAGVTDSRERYRIRVLGRITFKDTPIHIQEHVLDMLAVHSSVGGVAIDRTGHAIDLCDRLRNKWGEFFTEENFSAKRKSELGSRMQLYFEQGLPWYPVDKDLINQVYALKRIVTKMGTETIQAPETADNHADGGWSLALAMYYCPVPELVRETSATVDIQKPKEHYEADQMLREYLRKGIAEERNSFGKKEQEVWW